MRKRTAYSALTLLFLFLISSPTAFAADDSPWHLGIAIGAGERSNPLINADDIDINAVIDFAWYGERFFFDNGDVGFLLHENNRLAVNLVATWNNERNFYNYLTGQDLGLNILQSLGDDFRFTSVAEDAAADTSLILIDEEGELISRPPDFGDNNSLNLASVLADTELPGRKGAINSGLEFLYISPYGDFQAQLLTDVSATHNGQEAWLSWTHPWYFATATGIDEIALTLGLEWKSRDLVSYFYGVRPDEAFPGRPVYNAGSGTNAFIRLSARHSFSNHWQLVSMIERESLSSAIENSPIVKDDSVDTFFVGLFYRF